MSITRNAWISVLCLLPLLALGSAKEEPAEGEGAPGFKYIEMVPPFVVNIGDSGRVGYLKAEISLRVDGPSVAAVELHMPALRHEIIMVLSNQSAADLASPEQRENLRLEALEAVRAVIAEASAPAEAAHVPAPEPAKAAKPSKPAKKTAAAAPAEAVQDLLFTSFITQL